MRYVKIAALVPQGEHFDESAILNEGGWISSAHLSAIESALGGAEIVQNALDAANGTITSRDAEIVRLQGDYSQVATQAQQQQARIDELTAQVVALGRKPSGNGTPLAAGKKDESTETKPVPSYLDENNPANQWADKFLPKGKK